jgi:hypothetical protein
MVNIGTFLMQVEAHEIERAQRKIKRHRPPITNVINGVDTKMKDATVSTTLQNVYDAMEFQKILVNESESDIDSEEDESEDEDIVPSEVKDKVETTNLFTGGPSKW